MYYPYWSIISSSTVWHFWLRYIIVLIHLYWTTGAGLTDADVDVTTWGLHFSVTSLMLHVSAVCTLPSPRCSPLIFLELVLSSSLQNQFSNVAKNAFIKSDLFASDHISFIFTENLCYWSFKIMPSKAFHSNIHLQDWKWVWFHVPCS